MPLGALRLAAARMHRLHYIRQAALRSSCRKCRFIAGTASCGARLFVVADFVSLAVTFKKATGSLTPSLLLSAKSHAALRLLAYKCARYGSTCYQLFADTWLCADAHRGSPTAAPTHPSFICRRQRKENVASCGAQNRRARLLPLPVLTTAPTPARYFPPCGRSQALPFPHLWRGVTFCFRRARLMERSPCFCIHLALS